MKTVKAYLRLSVYFGMIALFSFSSPQEDVMKIMFEGEKACVSNLPPKQAFRRFDPKMAQMFRSKEIRSITNTRACNNPTITIESGDSSVLIGPIMDIVYNTNCSENVFNLIVKESYNIDHYINDDWWQHFLKAGRVFCLDKKKSTIRVIVMNGCSDPKKLQKLYTYFQEKSSYDQVFAVRCGGAPEPKK